MNYRLLRFLHTVVLFTTFVPLFAQGAQGGSVFYEKFRLLSQDERESIAVQEIRQGNYPEFLDNPVPVSFKAYDSKKRLRDVTVFVFRDYISVGNTEDYFIIPLTPMAANEIAEYFDAFLPTPMLVDTIYDRSHLKLEPFNYIPRGNRNETPDILYDHSKVIQAQIKAAGEKPGVFVAGTKKDVVISSKLNDSKRDHHVTIYGWHKPDGNPIQPVTNIHINTYVDYSHGVRLVLNKVLVDGLAYSYDDILRDSVMYPLLTREESPFKLTSYY